MPTGPQARLGDLHSCTLPPGFPSPITIPIPPTTVIVGKKPAAKALNEMTMSGPPPPVGGPPIMHNFPLGSITVMMDKRQALRVGDMCMFGGAIVLGEFTVITGG